MNGIDIAGHQKGINLAAVPCDFVIIKATQGTSFVNPEFIKQISQAMALNKYIGIYHYAGGGAGAVPEAEHFIKTIKPYIGKAILVLDWEGEQNPKFNSPTYAMAFLNYVKQQTGIVPFIYMSKSVCRQYSRYWDSSFPLWAAQYKKVPPTTYVYNPWTDDKGFGAWNTCKIYQYSSKGQLPGYGGALDLDLSYIDGAEWLRWASGDLVPEQQTEPIPPQTTSGTNVYPTLKRGDRSEYVRAWQTFLNLNGYSCGTADGIFGAKTLKAVKAWQKAHGLKADGIIGAKTWASLPMLS